MVVLSCPIPECDYKTEDVEIIGAAALLNLHAQVHATATATAPNRAPRLERPKLQSNLSNEDWNAFSRRFETFRIGSSISDASASGQLLECASEQLANVVLRAHPEFTRMPLATALPAIKALAVIPVDIGVLRADLAAMTQDPDETFRTFAARVQGKAETCEFKTVYNTKCPTCKVELSGDTYYTEEAIRDVLLNGIADLDIRRDALSCDGIQKKSTNEVIALVESKEIARNANPTNSVAALSGHKRLTTKVDTPNTPSAAEQAKKALCPDCGNRFHIFTRGQRGWNRRPHSKCASCWKKGKQTVESSPIIHSQDTEEIGQISAISGESIILDHHIFTKGEWRRAQINKSPCVKLNLSIDGKDGISRKSKVQAVADSGAQSDIWSLDAFLSAGFKKTDLSPVSLTMKAANKSPIRIDGAFFAVLSGKAPSGRRISYRSMIYVSRDVKRMYLSYDSMIGLGILGRSFPCIGQFNNVGSVCATIHEACSCPERKPVPPRPDSLPFPCSPDHIEDMRSWINEYYGDSVFNQCPHQEAPCMSGPPVEIHIKENVTPRACHKPSQVPVHWQETVHNDLLRDEALGIIERVPFGEPVEWCHRMVVTRKPSNPGSPRRTVDLSPLNKHCKRETHNSESPFHAARRVPKMTWKTVTDAWNGYHSVPLRESDRKLTTFITPWGRWRYKRLPQGFVSSQDGYNRRYDAILADFQGKERIVDDTVFYDESLEEHWWRTIDFLTTVGKAGIILNPKKFQFSQREVDFAGFRITDERLEPLPKTYSAIKNFPTPSSTTDIRSWFGLINQVANYAKLREYLEPFRPFLSPRTPFKWSDELSEAFEASKLAIIEAIKQGIEIFDLEKPTCLRTDWSSQGLGYFLLQKHCQCESIQPDCCTDGWRVTLAGSRFLSATEQHYAPIEGEALAILWGLTQTKFFTMGCHNLIVATDHKPLVKIFGDRTLDEIENPRLFRIKQRTLRWYFTTVHVPGESNQAADATSRRPSTLPYEDELLGEEEESLEESILAASMRSGTESITTITWDKLQQETSRDADMISLMDAINQGFPDSFRALPSTSHFWQYRDRLYIIDGVVIYDDRVVVPTMLRNVVLEALHAAHQGISSMGARARETVFWPGMSEDIQKTRQTCQPCIKIAPSQPDIPARLSMPPSTPFEQIFADFFNCAGHHYLVIGDRLSGWCDVFEAPNGSAQAGAEGLITNLRNLFSRIGVPDEISSDGGPEFKADATKRFLQQWGVAHRISAAYNPKSNGRAEVAVKAAKRLLLENTGPFGSLNTDHFLRGMLQLRNTPDPDCHISPAQIVFGRPLRDAFSFVSRLEKFKNPNIRPTWREAWDYKEEALRQRFHRSAEKRDAHAHPLPTLNLGDRCYIQNQAGNFPKRWDRSGTVMEINDFDSYTLKVDGTGRVTRRNRKYLRKFEAASPNIMTATPFGSSVDDTTNQTAPTAASSPVSMAVSSPAPTAVFPPAPTAATLPAPTAVSTPAPTAAPSPDPSPISSPAPATPIRPTRGRPKKKKNFFRGRPQHLVTMPQQDVSPEVTDSQPPYSAIQHRPQRIRNKPDWYGINE